MRHCSFAVDVVAAVGVAFDAGVASASSGTVAWSSCD